MNSIAVPREFDLIDDALRIESRARAAMVAIGEHWVQLQEVGLKPTDEELALHSHLVRHWRKAAHALNELLEQPIDRPRPRLEQPPVPLERFRQVSIPRVPEDESR